MVLREVPIQISADDQHLNNFKVMPPTWFSAQNTRQASSSINFGMNMFDCDLLCAPLSVTMNCCESLRSYDEEMVACFEVEDEEETLPKDDQEIVRYLINQQTFDGLWELNSKNIEHGKPLSHFQQLASNEVLVSAIIVLVLETRFVSFSSMWHGVVQKARKRLLDLYGNDNKKLNTLFEDIHKQL